MTDKKTSSTGSAAKTSSTTSAKKTTTAHDEVAALRKRVKTLEDRVDTLVARLGGAIGVSVE